MNTTPYRDEAWSIEREELLEKLKIVEKEKKEIEEENRRRRYMTVYKATKNISIYIAGVGLGSYIAILLIYGASALQEGALAM